jgi:hypothetical protein
VDDDRRANQADDGAVKKVPIGGGPAGAIAESQANPTNVVVDATSVYWTNQGTLVNNNFVGGSVMKAPQ